jgi:hypothetical protein
MIMINIAYLDVDVAGDRAVLQQLDGLLAGLTSFRVDLKQKNLFSTKMMAQQMKNKYSSIMAQIV